MSGFISGLKGKLAEFKAAETLEQSGFADVSIAASPVQPGWDISAVNQAGETVLFQVKTGSDAYAPSVMADMRNEAGVDFMVGSELHAAIGETSPDLANRLTEIGSILNWSQESRTDSRHSASLKESIFRTAWARPCLP